MKKTVEVLFSGKVQKVGFRAYVKDAALSLGLSGEVENLADGRVRALITGEEAIIEKCISMTYSCPRAVIRQASETEYVYTEFSGFFVKRE